MDKAKIKKFSQYARSKLIPEMEQLIKYRKSAQKISWWISVWNHIFNDSLSLNYSKAIDSLSKKVDKDWLEKIAEEAAYIRFNRIVALRFMEVNKYLPTKTSLFNSSDWTGIPDIVKNIDNELINCWCDKRAIEEYVWKYDPQSIQELYGIILVSLCNKLSDHYWFMFSEIDDWTVLLFPRTILDASHILRDKNNWILNIVDEDWKEVEIIWWIYQYYISEKKDDLFEAAKTKKQKFGKNELWAVTQLFTPKWIVKYMVQNTVWKTWLQNYPNLELQKKWEFYIKWESDSHVKISSPEELTLLDPACWSWHILVVGFEVLFEIYKSAWYMDEDIPELIINNNLYWFEIDERAHQLACFAVLMKAKQYDKNIENKVNIWDHIICIWENNNYDKIDEEKYPNLRSFVKLWYNWKVYGSLMKMNEVEINEEEILKEYEEYIKYWTLFDHVIYDGELNNLIHQYHLMHNQYVCVVANPPYMWGGNMDEDIKFFVNKEYSDYKSDLFAPFVVKCLDYCIKSWKIWLVTPFVWMYIQSYENLRKNILDNTYIASLVKPSYTAFFESAIVPLCSYCIEKHTNYSEWKYFDLWYLWWADEQAPKLLEWIKNSDKKYLYSRDQNNYKKIPWSPISYIISESVYKVFEDNESIWNICDPRQWIITWDNDRFLRLWFEVDNKKINKKWFYHNKWWEYRKWYWNQEYVINWENEWYEIKNFKIWWKLRSRPQNLEYNFKESISRSMITSSAFSARYYPNTFTFNVAWLSCFPEKENIKYILWLLNTNLINFLTKSLNPTMNMNVGDLSRLPVLISSENKNMVDGFSNTNINISKQDRDSFETSWDFKEHPLIEFKWNNDLILNCFTEWHNKCVERTQNIKNNEEELNKIFNKIYGLEWEIDPTVSYDDITIWKADRTKDIKSLLSYIIWCIMWRYSLDQEWLIYAWWEFDKSKYTKFKADDDGIIPILDKDYSDDDIVERTKEFVKKVWWDAFLDGNLNWIAESLEPSSNKTADQVIRDYYNKWFYDDHCQTYQKRPIYRLFVSNPSKPKDSAFKALVYMHRYSETTIQDLRRNYVQNYQQKLLEERSRIENNNDKVSQKRVAEIDKINSELTAYANKLKDFAETRQWGIDLDDWVKVNYWMFMDAGIVAKIKL